MTNPLDFSGKVALITGAASGMGLATAHAFAEAGAAVVLADFKEEAVKAAEQKFTSSAISTPRSTMPVSWPASPPRGRAPVKTGIA